jgi:4-oxalmesaconate hydratase
LFKVIEIDSLMFASEMIGAVRGKNPDTGFFFDDTKRYVDAVQLSDSDRQKVFEGTARKVFPRLDARLKKQGK